MTRKERERVIDSIMDLKTKGFTKTEITRKLNISFNMVLKAFRSDGSKHDKRGTAGRKITYNPFLPLTSESYYWIGFLAADGHITSNSSYGIVLHQSGKNKSHMLKYHKFLKYKPNILKYKPGNSDGLLISFGNQEAHTYLTSIGVTFKKSLTLHLKIPLNWDIVRGFFDGDGSYSWQPKHHSFIIGFACGSKLFTKQLQEFFTSENIACTVRKENSKMFRLTIPAKSRYSFIHKMYYKADMYMLRKHYTIDKFYKYKNYSLHK